MNFINRHKTEIIIFVLSLAVHTALFTTMVFKQGSVLDVVRVDDGYYEITENLLAGNGFSWSNEAPYEPNPLRTPGYIYILAGLISVFGVTGASIIQLVLASFIPVLGLYIARHITKSQKIGLLTGIILALDPTLAFLSFQFYTDTAFLLLFLPWLLITLHYADKPSLKKLIVSALILGVAILVRPVVQFLPILMAVYILWQSRKTDWKRGVMHVVIYFTIIGAILTPWIIRNLNTFGSPGLSSQSAFILYTNFVPALNSVVENTDFLEERNSFLTDEEYKGDAITLANADIYTKKSIEIIRRHPTETAYIMSKSLFTFFTNDGFYSLFAQLHDEPRDFIPIIVIMKLFWVLITISAFIGALRYLLKNRSMWALFIVILVAYFALTSTITAFGTNPRYRLPVDPIILALAGIGFTYMRSWIESLGILQKIRKRP